jgi:3-deoxy-7-phosphoheptulonate synthase
MGELNLKVTKKREKKVVYIGDTKVGNGNFLFCAGPCAVESAKMMQELEETLKTTSVNLLRGGAFKPRTSPYSFQGLGKKGLEILKETSKNLGIPFVTEATDSSLVPLVAEYADAIQIGSRNMNAYELLKAVGKQNKPVILKRGMAATVEEFLLAAEYILNEGNENVILCERGIRSFDNIFRNILDFNTVAWLKDNTFLPVIVDPSHGSGRRELVSRLSVAALALGADGVMVETHPAPEYALSDGKQSLTPEELKLLDKKLQQI